MKLDIRIPDSVALNERARTHFEGFLQSMANRYVVGALMYGDPPKARQRYMTRLTKELRAYRKSGNAEQLMNIAVYCFLESEAPENKKLYFDPTVASVTRDSA